MFFTTPASFNSNYVSWFFNPMLGHEYFPSPKLLVLIGQIAWQLSSGLVCIIYLVVNRTIRQGVIELVIPQSTRAS
ncbi:hypothetical protein KIN20_011928 [Parelaphostrongylus tenuis]|uniref:Uncharacterized protein n=1 Tax=Parelaphostrongylus tenuis TaxID=148309 RepID=A0AAD5MBH4_PARTN|nr:hypothetical protein KIN20_011928 [Parelaphostrongylus tenuis]